MSKTLLMLAWSCFILWAPAWFAVAYIIFSGSPMVSFWAGLLMYLGTIVTLIGFPVGGLFLLNAAHLKRQAEDWERMKQQNSSYQD